MPNAVYSVFDMIKTPEYRGVFMLKAGQKAMPPLQG
jgi:hypothetical protein